MIKYVLTFLFFIAVTAVMGQKKSVINILSSESIQGVKINGVDVLKIYKGVFQQDYSTLQSDSAYFHQKENTFDAFGHVLITQGDSHALHIGLYAAASRKTCLKRSVVTTEEVTPGTFSSARSVKV